MNFDKSFIVMTAAVTFNRITRT